MNERKNPVRVLSGNVDKNTLTYRSDLHCYHVLATTRMIDPRNPTFPIVKQRIIVFRPCDWKAYFQGGAEVQAGYLKAMNIQEASLIWDPELPGAKELNKVVLEEQARERAGYNTEPEHKVREGRRKATVQDIRNIVDKKEKEF